MILIPHSLHHFDYFLLAAPINSSLNKFLSLSKKQTNAGPCLIRDSIVISLTFI